MLLAVELPQDFVLDIGPVLDRLLSHGARSSRDDDVNATRDDMSIN